MRTTPEQRQAAADYRAWLDQVGTLAGRYIANGSDDEDTLSDYYNEGCEPDEAAAVLRALLA